MHRSVFQHERLDLRSSGQAGYAGQGVWMLPSKYSPHNTQNFFVHLLRFLPLALIFEDISKIVHAAECLDAPLPELGASLSALLCSCPQLPAISIVKDSREVVHGSAPPDAPLRMAISTSLCISSASCHLP